MQVKMRKQSHILLNIPLSFLPIFGGNPYCFQSFFMQKGHHLVVSFLALYYKLGVILSKAAYVEKARVQTPSLVLIRCQGNRYQRPSFKFRVA